MRDTKKPAKKLPLHQFIATGGKPKDFQGSQGVDEKTVPNIKRKASK